MLLNPKLEWKKKDRYAVEIGIKVKYMWQILRHVLSRGKYWEIGTKYENYTPTAYLSNSAIKENRSS